jgi:hypothetical protein
LGAKAGYRSGDVRKGRRRRLRFVTCSARGGARQFCRCHWQLVGCWRSVLVGNCGEGASGGGKVVRPWTAPSLPKWYNSLLNCIDKSFWSWTNISDIYIISNTRCIPERKSCSLFRLTLVTSISTESRLDNQSRVSSLSKQRLSLVKPEYQSRDSVVQADTYSAREHDSYADSLRWRGVISLKYISSTRMSKLLL